MGTLDHLSKTLGHPLPIPRGKNPGALRVFGAVHSIFPFLEKVCSVGLALSPAIHAHRSYLR